MGFAQKRGVKSLVFICLIFLVVGCDTSEKPVGRMPPTLSVGAPAPDFEYQPLATTEISLKKFSQSQGKVIYLDFWASWCKPCLISMPKLDRLRSELKGKGFEVIAVNLDDDPEKGRVFLAKHRVNYPVVQATDDTITDLYQIYGLPTSYLVDRQGVLRYVHQGFREGDLSKIRHEVEQLLN